MLQCIEAIYDDPAKTQFEMILYKDNTPVNFEYLHTTPPAGGNITHGAPIIYSKNRKI